MINKTQLNKLRIQIDKNKLFLDGIVTLKADDNKKNSMAVSMSVLMEYLNINQTTAFDAITDAGNDNKIDAFYYSDDEDELSELVIIQSKYKNIDGDTGTFNEDEIKICIGNCKRILKGENFQNIHPSLEEKLSNYRQLLGNNGGPPVFIKLFFATNGVVSEAHKKLNEVINCVDDNINIIWTDATFFDNSPVLDTGEITINLKDDADKTDSIFFIKDDLYSGRVVSCSLQELMEFYKKTGERLLLSNNVRYFVKNSSVNKEIKKSFIDDPKRFCYLNNGVTIICTKYDMNPTALGFTKVTITKPSIVNGGQTVASLYQLYSSKYEEYIERFRSAHILIRIYRTPTEYAIKIAKATNSQNPISVVDLHANDIAQEKAKAYLSKFGIGLINKRGEDISFYDDIISNENILQVYAALFYEDPAKAKASKAAVFKKYYNLVFNDEINDIVFKKLHRCYQISKFIQSKELVLDKVVLQNAFYSVIYAMKKLNANIINENIPESSINSHFDTSFEKAITIITKIIEQKQIELKTKYSMNNLFKNSEIKDLIDLETET